MARKWVLPAWEGPDSPQSPVPVDEPALSGAEWRKAARKAAADQARAARNRRGKRPDKPITGIIKRPGA